MKRESIKDYLEGYYDGADYIARIMKTVFDDQSEYLTEEDKKTIMLYIDDVLFKLHDSIGGE